MKKNKQEKRISYKAMTSQGEDPLLKFMGDEQNEEKQSRAEEDEIPTESTHKTTPRNTTET